MGSSISLEGCDTSVTLATGLNDEEEEEAVSITCMTYTYCCVYSARLLMMDRDTVRNM